MSDFYRARVLSVLLLVCLESSVWSQEATIDGTWKRGPEGNAAFDPKSEGEVQTFAFVNGQIEKRNSQNYIAIYKPADNTFLVYDYVQTLNADRTVAHQANPGDGKLTINGPDLLTNVIFGKTYYFKRFKPSPMPAGPKKSVDDPIKVTVVFENKTGKPLDAIWVDYNGNEVAMPAIAANSSASYASHKNALWRFKLAGQQVQEIVVNANAQQTHNISQDAMGASPEFQFAPSTQVIDLTGSWKYGPVDQFEFADTDAVASMVITKTGTGISVKSSTGNTSTFENHASRKNTYLLRSLVNPSRNIDYKGTDNNSYLVAMNPNLIGTMTGGVVHYLKRDVSANSPVTPPKVQPAMVKPPRVVPPEVKKPQLPTGKSIQGNAEVKLVFENKYGKDVNVVWVDGNGQEVVMQQLANSSSLNLDGREGHLFRFKNTAQLVKEYRVTAQPSQTVVVSTSMASPVTPPRVKPTMVTPPSVVKPTAPRMKKPQQPYTPGKTVAVTFRNFLKAPLTIYMDHPSPDAPEFAITNMPMFLPYLQGYPKQPIPIPMEAEVGTLFRFAIDDLTVARYYVDESDVQEYEIRNMQADVWLTKDQVYTSTPKRQSLSWSDRSGQDAEPAPDMSANHLGYCLPTMHPYDFQRRGVPGAIEIFDYIDSDSKDYRVAGPNYLVPNFLVYKSAKNAEAQMEGKVFTTSAERQKAFAANVGIEAGYEGFGVGGSVSMEGNYGRTKGSATSTNSVQFFATAWQSKYWLSLDKKHAKLSQGFRDFVFKPRNFKSESEGKRFFELVGTHYPLAVLYGGRIYKDETIESSSYAKSLATEWGIQGEVKGSGYGVSAAIKGGYSENKSQSKFNSTELSKIRCAAIGGGSANDFASWTLEGSKDLVPIRVELRPIYELIRPEYFPNRTEIEVQKMRQELQAAYLTYIGNRRKASQSGSGAPKIFKITINQPGLTANPGGNYAKVHHQRSSTTLVVSVSPVPVNETTVVYPGVDFPILFQRGNAVQAGTLLSHLLKKKDGTEVDRFKSNRIELNGLSITTQEQRLESANSMLINNNPPEALPWEMGG